MKIIFVLIGDESLGVEFLSSFLKKNGHETEVFLDPNLFDIGVFRFKKISKLFDTKKELVKEILSHNPDIVGFTSFTATYQRSLSIAKELKKIAPKMPTIFGGIHPTSVPDVVIKEKSVDYVCVGEGEQSLLELLNNLKNPKKIKKIKNIWGKENGKIFKNQVRQLIKNIDLIPFPDKELFYKNQPNFVKNEYFTTSSRGCPFGCTYCSNNVIQKTYRGISIPFRQRSPKNLIDELYIAKTKYKTKRYFFVDDVFVRDFNWLKEFVRLYQKKINLPYMVVTHPRFLSYQVTRLLAKSGCELVSFGIQTASEETRTKILKRFESNKDIEFASKNCHKAKLPFSVDHIFCLPGETIEHQVQSLKFYNKLRPNKINSNWLQYFPRTEIIETAIKMKKMSRKMVPKIEKGITNTSYLVGLSVKDTFNDLIYTNIQFLFIILPYLPKSVVDKIIEKKRYLLPFKIPMIINTSFMILITILKGKTYLYIDAFKLITFYMIKNTKLKLKYLFQ